ncbi:hypothetical protein [Vibrio coralliilyticus]|uniref:hypothetical protein n=1 Tax=Vibrio coralliilyticus TaxID=190893 RepID=UPI0015617734|nr:hypothetical protein [Vibrio coralliilyticus]NRF28362.1 hypothetical protein [Vibrio coralliilyticus]NRF51827.1 hypothetical protein [Vibrio coralliilyticus]
MSIVATIMGHLITACSALLAIHGETWDHSRKGIKKLTKIGLIAAILAVTGLTLSIYQSIDKHNKEQAYQTHALEEMKKGWSLLFLPFEALYFQIHSKKIENGDYVKFAQTLLVDNSMLEQFDNLDFKEMHKFQKLGTLGSMVCSQTISGMGIIKEQENKYSDFISLEIKQDIENIQKSSAFSELIRHGGCPSIFGQAGNNPDKYNGVFNKDSMRDYIKQILEFEKYFK